MAIREEFRGTAEAPRCLDYGQTVVEIDPLAWATEEAARLHSLGYDATDGSASRAQQFLRQQSPRSEFYESAVKARGMPAPTMVEIVADSLLEWVAFAGSGMAEVVSYEERFRIDAATDLMEQVETLLADKKVHPAVPVMLAGAALEEFLRAMFESTGERINGSPSIAKYGDALKKAGAVDKNNAHQLTSMAATRNDAAHGKFEEVTRDGARLFADRVNFFIAQHK